MAHTHSRFCIPFCGRSWITKHIKKTQDQGNLWSHHGIVLWLNNIPHTPTLSEPTAPLFGRQFGKMNSEGCTSTISHSSTVFGHVQLAVPHQATVDVPMVDSYPFTFLPSGPRVNFPMTTPKFDSDMSSTARAMGSRSHRNVKPTSRPRGALSMCRSRRANCTVISEYDKKALRRLVKVEENTPKPAPAKPAEHHHSACGCSPGSAEQKNKEVFRLEGVLLVAKAWGDLTSPSDKAYDFDRPELPSQMPKHRTRTPIKSCLKKVTRVNFCDDLDSGESDSECSFPSDDDSDNDSICHSFDGDNASRTGRAPRFGKEKKVKSVHFGKALCLRTGQDMVPTPRTPENISRVERYKARQKVEKKYHKMLAHDEEEVADMSQPPSIAFDLEDDQVERRLLRAVDISLANERAAVGRGALDFLIFVCRKSNSVGSQVSENLVDRLIKHRGNLPVVGSYHGEEREYANPGRSNVSPVPAHMYRDCHSSMSWVRMDEVDEMDTSL